MIRCVLFIATIFSVFTGCTNNPGGFTLEPMNGLIIRITDMKIVKSQNRIIGFIEIENKTESLMKISNRELFLYCGSDSASALVKMPGEWEIDKGLINVSNNKPVRYQVYWPLKPCKDIADIRAGYVMFLDREDQ